ncbi:MAG: hypothetical protein H7259_06120 [Cytophagales bacterium]|nr:hypothetical protein [Cytophaga sp.]
MKKILFACTLLVSITTAFAAVNGGNPDYKHPFTKMPHTVHHSHHAMIPFDHYKI